MLEVEELDSPNAVPPKTPPPNYGQATALPPKPRFASTTTLPPARLPLDESAPELDETTKQQLGPSSPPATTAAGSTRRGRARPCGRSASATARRRGAGLAARGGARF